MNFHVEYLEEQGIIKSTVEGDVFKKEMVIAQTKVRELILKTKCYFLLDDFINATFKIPIFEINDMPKETTEFKVEMKKEGLFQLREAILVAKIDEDIRFIENVFNNNGLPIKVFTDKNQAMEWLLQRK